MHKIKLLSLVCLFALSLSACATATKPQIEQPQYSGAEYYNFAVDYYNNGLYDLSYNNFLAADSANYNKVASQIGSAAALIAQNKAIDAVGILESVLGQQNNNAEAWYNLGLAYYSNNNIEQAVAALRNATKLSPNNAQAWTALGVCFLQKKQYDVAAEQFTESIKLNPNDIVALHNRAIAYIESKYFEAAESDLDKMLDLSRGSDKNALSGLAQIAFAKKDYLLALDFINQAISLDSTDGILFYNRGLASQELGKYDEALVDLNRSLAYEQNFVEGYIARGDLQFILRDFDAACQDLKIACKLGDCTRLENAKAAGQCTNKL